MSLARLFRTACGFRLKVLTQRRPVPLPPALGQPLGEVGEGEGEGAPGGRRGSR